MVKGGEFFFQRKKMVKKGHYGNEDLCLAWDRMEVRQVALFTTTKVQSPKNVFVVHHKCLILFGIKLNC